MKIVVASDSFKGSLSSRQIMGIVREEAARLLPGAACAGMEMADGGEGTLDAVAAASPGSKVVSCQVHGPLLEPRVARLAVLDGGASALVEMAEASGLTLAAPERRDPLMTTTFGTGELVRAALDEGCRHITLAVGGSATNDGGMGLMRALGARFLDGDGAELEGRGRDLGRVGRIDLSNLDPRLAGCSFTLMSDVDNPLLGPDGATRTFGPQKGAGPAALEALEAGMARYAAVVAATLGRDLSAAAGAGAAGGLAFAAMAFLGAREVPGAEEMLRLARFDDLLEGASLCITGEGRLDAQTGHGKAVSAVAAHCREAGVPCVAIVGAADPDARPSALGLAGIERVTPPGMPLDEAMRRAGELYRYAADRVIARLAAV